MIQEVADASRYDHELAWELASIDHQGRQTLASLEAQMPRSLVGSILFRAKVERLNDEIGSVEQGVRADSLHTTQTILRNREEAKHVNYYLGHPHFESQDYLNKYPEFWNSWNQARASMQLIEKAGEALHGEQAITELTIFDTLDINHTTDGMKALATLSALEFITGDDLLKQLQNSKTVDETTDSVTMTGTVRPKADNNEPAAQGRTIQIEYIQSGEDTKITLTVVVEPGAPHLSLAVPAELKEILYDNTEYANGGIWGSPAYQGMGAYRLERAIHQTAYFKAFGGKLGAMEEKVYPRMVDHWRYLSRPI